MLASLKRWFTRDPAGAAWADIDGWARQAGHRFARARDGEGFVVEGRPWRLEWGPPQRVYLSGHELRIRAELGFASSLQMLVMSRGLMEALESDIFERSTQDLQTHVDMSTPEEMRWLSMFAKCPLPQRALRPRFGGVASDPALLAAWVDDAVAGALTVAAGGLLADEPPFVLMTLRGRLYLRAQVARPTLAAVQQAVAVFEAAAASARRVADSAEARARADADSVTAADPSTAWQNQFPPELEQEPLPSRPGARGVGRR